MADYKQWEIREGDVLARLAELEDGSIQTVITSPPYWGLRDYGVEGQIGLEPTPEAYTARMVAVFTEVRRVLRDDGTLWINLGDSYSRQAGDDSTKKTDSGMKTGRTGKSDVLFKAGNNVPPPGMKPKDLIGIPWRIAFALQSEGWYLRSDIIWAKPNPMPESVKDRPTKAHEYLFLMAKSDRYYYDADAIAEQGSANVPWSNKSNGGIKQAALGHNAGGNLGQPARVDKQRGHSRRHDGFNDRWDQMEKAEQCSGMRNKRDVWTIATQPFPEAHFATFPEALVLPCIKAGSKPGDIVLDPFAGSGTVGVVAQKQNRRFVGIELNSMYCEMARRRIEDVNPLFNETPCPVQPVYKLLGID